MHEDNTNKKRYIIKANEILREDGVEGLSIRRLARELGCTNAVLYRHFDNLEHLLLLASLAFAEPYTTFYHSLSQERIQGKVSLITAKIIYWRAFLHEEFKYYPFYEILFFSGNDKKLEDYVVECYQLFPGMHQAKDYDAIDSEILFGTTLEEREYLGLMRCVDDGAITRRNARYLSMQECAVCRGIFASHKQDHDYPGIAESAEETSLRLILDLNRLYFNKDIDMDRHIEEVMEYDLSSLDKDAPSFESFVSEG